jgi:LmbE family N-acetylglucosaminyl deacetylase
MKRTILKLAKPVVVPLNGMLLANYYKRDLQLATIDAKKILVLAPHVDDETIGCGGTIVSLADEGKDVHCLYITDGAKSVSTEDADVLIKKRKEEAYKVKEILGIASISFFDEPDGNVSPNVGFVEKLMDYIETFKPEVIFCPTFVDCHTDHVQTGIALAKALQSCSFGGQVWCYEINCPIEPAAINAVIDVTKYQPKKEKAIDVFQSQAIDFDGFVSLSSIKKHLLAEPDRVTFVETFFVQSFEQFAKNATMLAEQKVAYSQVFKQVNKTETLLWGIYQNRAKKQALYNLLEGL